MYIILFIFTSKLLTNCILVWNHRLDRVLNQGERYRRRSEKHSEHMGFDHLFKDYVCILDLMEGADVIFANTVESFYATQVISIIFELFYLYQSLTVSPEFRNERRVDVLVMGLFVTQSIVFLYQASISASEVAERSLEGLEIIRRKGILGRRSDEELYFVMSLYMSYTGHFDIGINASKMFTFNKSFLISMFILAFTFFIIVVQFTPILQMTDDVKLERIRRDITETNLATFVEGFYGKAGLTRTGGS
ncbi:unnamed protein product [Allacma fusca]|uniref:Gustatory receptor n=1 Tax=Allacma fusca TaxID=39272 RepID=A0A8J2K0T3_9HEXA|nr:unnamed protein product [Allacma fusca]